MHELSIALSIIDVAVEQAEPHPGRVVAIHLKLGPLSGVDGEALRLAYGLAREGGPLEQAELMIEEVPLVAYCDTCAVERTLTSPQLLCCPVCDRPTPRIINGRELEVVALEIEP
jgi:hydrogenase nickel incorporation protein HypA/HybF